MSKNITIQEGGVAKQLTVDKLKTNEVGGGTCLWIPEDEVQLTTKNITANGTYKASDDGYYGYSEVTVNGIGTATGTGPDGETHSYTEDGEGGVTDTVIPDSIAVVTPPTVTTYADGATIDFSGMEVKAYLKSGGVWSDAAHPNGTIPISELSFPVTVADKGETRSDEWSDGDGINAALVSYMQYWNVYDDGHEEQRWVSQVLGSMGGKTAALGGNGPTQFFATFYNNELYVFGSTADRNLNTMVLQETEKEKNKVWETAAGRSFSSGTGEVRHASGFDEFTSIPTSTVEPTGTPSLSPVDAYQTIPVQWIRPGDYKTLESSFEITVT